MQGAGLVGGVSGFVGAVAGDFAGGAVAGGVGEVVAVEAGAFEEVDEGAEVGFSEVAEQLGGELGDGLVHFSEEGEAGGRYRCEDHAAVLLVALLADELEGLEASEEAGDVGIGCDHTVANDGAGKAVGVSAAEDAEDVVLGAGDVPAACAALHGALEAVGGAGDVEESFFGGAAKGALLSDFGLEATHVQGSGLKSREKGEGQRTQGTQDMGRSGPSLRSG